ncbi:MAG: T9SS type A sorting domain-containing protein, partial [Candidatus Marinimicrobia bacterium]|nr:T9SS type A sorting domain-containing protein [Candidatus Neomarinimicrobiota bacterium]
KGFSNTYHSASDPWGGDYDPARIAILKRMADQLWEVDSSAYVILEHFADNAEEFVLADYGMLLWGNSNYNYNEATMGWHEDGKSDFSWGYYGTRGWTAPHLVTYMESHDEERLMYKNLTWGNASGNYSIKALGTALNRIKLAAAFFLTLPGPKMLWQFGELGYDYSIDYDGRLGEKPVRWDYLQDQGRYNLYLTMAALLRLRRENAVFGSSETQVALDLGRSSGLKRMQLSGESMSVIIIGNFGVTAQSIAPDFPATGTWYDFFPGDSLLVAAPDTLIDLRPGEFHIYTDQRLEPPEPGILNEPIAPPTALTLGRSYPNPFNPTTTVTTINYTVALDAQVRLVVYDLLGREVARLFDGPQEVGYHQAVWNGRTTTGRVAPSGIYLARLVAPESTKSIKMLLLRQALEQSRYDPAAGGGVKGVSAL